MTTVSWYLERALLTILSHGKVPEHIAMIMDGNRRYARTNGMQIKEGHLEGFENAGKVSDSRFGKNLRTSLLIPGC